MTGNEYLQQLLASQELKEGCDELVALDNERNEVDRIIKEAYPNSYPTFTHGGSRAKRTMIREDYDLDEVCYFANEDTAPGETLEDIYENIASPLTDEIRDALAKVAKDTLEAVDDHGWEHVFGTLGAKMAGPRVQVLRSAAATAAVPTRPWADAD